MREAIQLAAVSTSPQTHVIWAVFFAVVIIFTVYSLMLMYHWVKYTLNYSATLIASIIYLFVGALLIFMLAASAVALTVS